MVAVVIMVVTSLSLLLPAWHWQKRELYCGQRRKGVPQTELSPQKE